MAKPTQQEQVDCIQRCIDTLEVLLNHGSKSEVKQHELACMRVIMERISGQAQSPPAVPA